MYAPTDHARSHRSSCTHAHTDRRRSMHVVRFSDSDVAVIIPGGQVTPIPALRPRLRHAQLDPLRSRSAGGDVDDASCRAELLGVKQQLVALEAELTEADAVSPPSVTGVPDGRWVGEYRYGAAQYPVAHIVQTSLYPCHCAVTLPLPLPVSTSLHNPTQPTRPTNQPDQPTNRRPTNQPVSQPINQPGQSAHRQLIGSSPFLGVAASVVLSCHLCFVRCLGCLGCGEAKWELLAASASLLLLLLCMYISPGDCTS